MNWIDRLEKRFGRFAIPGIVRIIVAFNAFVFLLHMINPSFVGLLTLDPALIREGQVWRLFTYIFIPSIGDSWLMPGYLWIVFWLLFIWMMGDGLESVWGSFKLNLYILISMVAMTISAFIFGSSSTSVLINMSLLFAFATIDPDCQIYLIIFPVKIKWVAIFYLVLLAYSFLGGSLALRMGIVSSLSSYLIFFGPGAWREAGHRTEVMQRRKRFEKAAVPDDDAMHRCAKCNRTELTNPDLDFRVSSDGEEYCTEHLPSKVAG